MALRPGERFDRYELGALLGKGGMGEVYSAHDVRLHRPVALKILQSSGAGEADALGAARILREARAAAGIRHPNAVAIYDVGEVDGVPFLAMELVPGRVLRSYVGDTGVPLKRRLRWLVDVARALGAAHAVGVVHRDIKPENVMIGDDGIVKVLDFGIARRVTRSELDPAGPTDGGPLGTLTADGVVVGTPTYMAPEQMRGEPLDGSADQFAWGVLACELLTGKVPWDASQGSLALVAHILTRDAPPLRDANPEVPAAVDAAIRRALAKAPRGRFPTMDDLADAVEAYADAPGAGGERAGRHRSTPAPDPALTPTAPRTGEASSAEPSTRSQLAAPRAEWPSARVGWAALASGALVVLAIAVGAWRGLVRSPAGAASREAGAPSEVPSRMSSNAEATSAYETGMRALKDASLDTARTSLDRAVRLDPSFAAAQLARALVETLTGLQTDVIQAHLKEARAGRESLSESDRILLDALEPWASVPPDLVEARRRFEPKISSMPASPILTFAFATLLNRLDDADGAIEASQKTLALDPTFATAWDQTAFARRSMDDVAGAIDAENECLKISPGGETCLWSLARIERGLGKCADLVVTTRRILALTPDSAEAYRYLAGALAAVGEPLDAVRVALEKRWERLAPSVRRSRQADDEAALAVLGGELADAEAKYRELEALEANAPNEYPHFRGTYGRLLMLVELGRHQEAARVAASYLRRRAGWSVPGLATDLSIHVYAEQLAAGALSRRQFDVLRDRWVESDRAARRAAGISPAVDYIWTLAYAQAVQTAEDATTALALRGDAGRPFFEITSTQANLDEWVGRTYLLAQRGDDAIAFLERASGSCAAIDDFQAPFVSRATLELGEAYEARGDVARACAAYARFLARWGNASRPPHAASEARARARSLHCGD